MQAGHLSKVQRTGHRSEEHTSELQSQSNLVCRLLLEKKKPAKDPRRSNHDPQRVNQQIDVDMFNDDSPRIQLLVVRPTHAADVDLKLSPSPVRYAVQ